MYIESYQRCTWTKCKQSYRSYRENYQ